MNKFVTGLIWNHDAPTRAAGEVIEYRCEDCGKTVWQESWVADSCQLAARGRWGTVVLFWGRLSSTGNHGEQNKWILITPSFQKNISLPKHNLM